MAAHGFGVDVDGGSSGQLFSSSLNQPVEQPRDIERDALRISAYRIFCRGNDVWLLRSVFSGKDDTSSPDPPAPFSLRAV